MKLYLSFVVIFAVSFLVGCGAKDGYAELGLVEVTGTVTLDGKPLPQAKVVFETEDKRLATGMTDAAGHYALMYDSETRGCLPGPKTVRITTGTADVEGGGAAEGSNVGKQMLPARFNSKSELTADVSTANKTIDFKLTTAP